MVALEDDDGSASDGSEEHGSDTRVANLQRGVEGGGSASGC